jgi:hypothetical protein
VVVSQFVGDAVGLKILQQREGLVLAGGTDPVVQENALPDGLHHRGIGTFEFHIKA